MRKVFCLDTGREYCYGENITPYEAMRKTLYYLNMKANDSSVTIQKTETNKCLYMEHNGKTYATVI